MHLATFLNLSCASIQIQTISTSSSACNKFLVSLLGTLNICRRNRTGSWTFAGKTSRCGHLASHHMTNPTWPMRSRETLPDPPRSSSTFIFSILGMFVDFQLKLPSFWMLGNCHVFRRFVRRPRLHFFLGNKDLDGQAPGLACCWKIRKKAASWNNYLAGEIAPSLDSSPSKNRRWFPDIASWTIFCDFFFKNLEMVNTWGAVKRSEKSPDVTAGRGRIGLVPFSQTNSSTASLELTSSLHKFWSKQFGGNEFFLAWWRMTWWLTYS